MDWKTIWALAQPIVVGQLRHGLTVASGYLIANGALEASDQASFIKIGLGVASWIGVAAWSWWDKVGRARLLAKIAKMNPVASKNATTGEAVKAAEDAAAAVK